MKTLATPPSPMPSSTGSSIMPTNSTYKENPCEKKHILDNYRIAQLTMNHPRRCAPTSGQLCPGLGGNLPLEWVADLRGIRSENA
jgi:hypothetical protein